MPSAGTTPFYGREHELRRLQELAGKKTASLVIIKGRRRIGKSRLATELARRLPGYGALSFQGLPPTTHLVADSIEALMTNLLPRYQVTRTE
jgi:hypothetical protein